MTKPLPLTDFRAVRYILEPDDFAFPGEEVAPSDPVDRESWHRIMDLPDDVAIMTSDHQGSYLRLLCDLEGEWIKAVGTLNQDELSGCMLAALECFQCAMFDFLHGYYRSALANVRSALELTLIGVYGNHHPASKKYIEWKDGASQLSFTPLRRELFKVIDGYPNAQLLADGQLLSTIFEELCHFTHCRPDATDGDIWEGNGPVYSVRGVRLTLHNCLQVYAISFLLIRFARSNFHISKQARAVFNVSWLEHHEQLFAALQTCDGVSD